MQFSGWSAAKPTANLKGCRFAPGSTRFFATKIGAWAAMTTQHTRYERILDQLAALADDASRMSFLNRRPRLLSRAFVVRLDEAVVTLVRIDLKKASGLADAAVAIANKFGGSRE